MSLLRTIAIGFAILIIGSTGYGFAAGNAGLFSGGGGDGTGAISGYQVSQISYALNQIDPTRIDAISFSVDGDLPATARVRTAGASGVWYDCAASGGNRLLCTTPGLSIAAVQVLQVVAAD